MDKQREKLIELLDELGVTVDVPANVDEDGCGTYEIEGADMHESGKAEEDKEVKIGEMFSEMKLVIHEDNGMLLTEVDGKIETLPSSTVGIKLTYRGKQYGAVHTFEKSKLDTADIVTAVNSMFEGLKDAEAFRL